MNSKKRIRLIFYAVFTMIMSFIFYQGLINDIQIIKKLMAYLTIGFLAICILAIVMTSFEYAFTYKGDLSFSEYFKSEIKREFFNI